MVSTPDTSENHWKETFSKYSNALHAHHRPVNTEPPRSWASVFPGFLGNFDVSRVLRVPDLGGQLPLLGDSKDELEGINMQVI